MTIKKGRQATRNTAYRYKRAYKMRIYSISAALLFLAFSCQPVLEDASEAIPVSSPGATGQSVYLTNDEAGNPVMCWTEETDKSPGEKRFFYSIMTNGVFSPPTPIPIAQNARLHAEGMPKVAFRGNGDIIAMYEVKTASDKNPYAGEIHYILSTDRGETWTPPARVHADNSPHKGRAFFDITPLHNGEVGISWLDASRPGGGRPVKFAQTDASGRFTGETIVNSVACECCRTAIHADKNGKISIVYRDIINDSIRDISVSTSDDQGKTFSLPTCFSGDNWALHGCPHNGPDVVSDGERLHATWFTGAYQQGVYYATLDAKNQPDTRVQLSKKGKQIQLCRLPDNQIALVFNEEIKNYTPLYMEIQPSGQRMAITPEETETRHPVVTSTPDGSLIIAWIQQEKVVYKIVDDL